MSLLSLFPEIVCEVFAALRAHPPGFVRLLGTSKLTRAIFNAHWQYDLFYELVQGAALCLSPHRSIYLRCIDTKSVLKVHIGHDIVATREMKLTSIPGIGFVGHPCLDLWAADVCVNGCSLRGERTIQGRRYVDLKRFASSKLTMIVKVGDFAVPVCPSHVAIVTLVKQLERLPTYALDEKGVCGMIPRFI